MTPPPHTVAYEFALPYRVGPFGGFFPILQMRLANPDHPSLSIDVDGYLDSGAESSLFDGLLLRALGFELGTGLARTYKGTSGPSLLARLHPVVLSHPAMGEFRLPAAFSEVPLRRNLLGRDFFNLAQIGFRVNQLTLLITPRPVGFGPILPQEAG